ncbi:nucleic-acid-binding protein from transposon X-element [Trichonephila clavipes]|nr:nucleic-acid-binding protein from transposon X-element [Trichonephila clavipes]
MLESYTYQLSEEKELKVVIRGMPSDISPQQIIEGLLELGITVSNCHVMINRKTGLPMPLFLLSLPKNEINKDVSRFCTRNPKCVKCGQPHLTSDCKKFKDTDAACCHCQGNHPVNFSGCPKNPLNKPPPPQVNFWDERTRQRKEAMEAKKQKSHASTSAPAPPVENSPKPQPTTPQSVPTIPQPQSKPPTSSTSTSQDSPLLSTLKELQDPQVVELLTTMRKIVQIAKTEKTQGEKAVELCLILGIRF